MLRMLNTLALASLLASLLASPLASAQQEKQDTPSGIAGAGKRIYRQGMLPSGRPVEADTRADRPIAGQAAACANCHGRSGLGFQRGADPGSFRWRGLISTGRRKPWWPQLAHLSRTTGGKRPAYTDETLARAIREGVDANGRALGAPMPRYRLGDQDMGSAARLPERALRRADAGGERKRRPLCHGDHRRRGSASRKALLDVLQTYARSKSAGTRHESRRVTRGPWTMRDYRNYRNWRPPMSGN